MPNEPLNPWKILAWVADILAGIAILLCLQTSATLSKLNDKIADVEQKVAVMGSNRFTSADGLQVWKEISIIREQIAKLPNESPPKWFVERVEKLERNQERLETKMDINAQLLQKLIKIP